jgi:hypothetical protein
MHLHLRTYFRVFDAGGPRTRRRTRRIANYQNTMTTASAATGAARAKIETKKVEIKFNEAVLPSPPPCREAMSVASIVLQVTQASAASQSLHGLPRLA